MPLYSVVLPLIVSQVGNQKMCSMELSFGNKHFLGISFLFVF
jgi:hypothetical protein